MKITKYYDILNYLKNIISNTEFEGHVFSVGGCERDKHLGLQEIKDIDIVVDLKDGGIKFAKWLNENNYTKGSIVVYENFGTAMFKLKEFPNEEIEVVHTRKETYRDKNSRNPETAFGTIEEDCFRRDFTINALYHDISNDLDIDLTNMGFKDLEAHLIRTCSEPDIIYSDDPLRIMRAIRFSSKLSFELDEKTVEGIKKNAYRLDIISRERITDEFNKILLSANPSYGLKLLFDYGIIDVIMPDVYTKDEKEAIMEKFPSLVKSYRYSLTLALGFLFNNRIITSEIREKVMKEFKYSNEIIKEVNLYGTYSWQIITACAFENANKIREIAKICGNELKFRSVLAISQSLAYNEEASYLDFVNNVSDINVMFGYELPVTGEDVMEILDIESGKKVGEILRKIMEEAYKNPKINRKDCIKLMRKFYKNGKE